MSLFRDNVQNLYVPFVQREKILNQKEEEKEKRERKNLYSQNEEDSRFETREIETREWD